MNMKRIAIGRSLVDFSLKGEVIIFGDNEVISLDKIRGKILVMHSPSPEIVIYMNDVIAVITETGGVLCHAAVLALELDCPIIVGTEKIISKVKNGDKIELISKQGIGEIYEADIS